MAKNNSKFMLVSVIHICGRSFADRGRCVCGNGYA